MEMHFDSANRASPSHSAC